MRTQAPSQRCRSFDHAQIEAALRDVCARAGVDARALIHPARVALTGKTAGPGLFELTELLGRERAVERLRTRGTIRAGRGLRLLDPRRPAFL